MKSLQMLEKNGILSFVLPKNFLNCLYYDKTRKHIHDNYRILTIFECNDKYIETQQETIVIIIQNKKPLKKNKYIYNLNSYTIFGTPNNIKQLKNLYNDSTTLKSLGFKVSVGNIVWNQRKKELTDDTDKTLLIYSSDITKDNTLSIKTYSNPKKKNYIDKEGLTEPLLVLNRGYGVGKYNFNYCLINETDNITYLIENHLICISYTKEMDKPELIKLYKKIINSFNNKRTKKFIDLYFGNNAINTTELSEVLPIYFT